MDNIILVCYGNLGDELSMCRNIYLDLLFQKYITNDVVIFCNKDRKFLYENIFNKFFFVEDGHQIEDLKKLCEDKFNKKFDVVCPYNDLIIFPPTFWTFYGSYKNILDKELVVTNENILNFKKINYYNSQNHSNEFKDLIKNINYLDSLPCFNNDKFIVYHHRIKNDIYNPWDQNDETLQKILNYKEKYNIVIFTQKKLDIDDKNIYITSDLKEYASFIHSDNCLALISVWSGGGQFGYYCNNSKVISYFDECQMQYQDKLNNDMTIWINSENAFDFCKFSNCEMIFINKEEIDDLEKYI